ncbi:SDR family NAD(P)-dependent oxidoreductase [Microbacterium sp. E-13]|uniref:SDR family NAD(P)-dependent oxidoreductase n=1 Tax=Microbacterium sp. E-13 TaxID=3404048 RepID=UPI003CF153C9
MNVREQFDLTGAVALVTGSSLGGLGFHSASALHELGARLWLTDHESAAAELEDAAAALRTQGAEVTTVIADATSPAEVADLVDAVARDAGRLDVLAHHAGVNLRKSLWETTPEEWARVLTVNVTGTWLMARAASRVMADSGGGRIITLGSIYNKISGPIPESAYYASKGAIGNLTRGLAMELAPHGITVNCIAPGTFYPTRMTAALKDDPARLEAMARRTMLGRLGNPETDLKGAIAFLATPASQYVTGQTLYVDGGWTAW